MLEEVVYMHSAAVYHIYSDYGLTFYTPYKPIRGGMLPKVAKLNLPQTELGSAEPHMTVVLKCKMASARNKW